MRERNRVRSPHFTNYSSEIADKVVYEVTPLGTISYTYDAIGKRTSIKREFGDQKKIEVLANVERLNFTVLPAPNALIFQAAE